MSERCAEEVGVSFLSGVELLELAVDRLLTETPAELVGGLALARTSALLVARERLHCATLTAVRDVDRRELFTLEATGSTRGWLRTQLGGDQGQLALARRLLDRPLVGQAFADGQIPGRAVTLLCGALERVPSEVDEPALLAALTDGLAGLLGAHTGLGVSPLLAPSPSVLAVRAELAAVVAASCAATELAPAARLEPAFLLLARHLSDALLGWALNHLLDALLPDGIDLPPDSDYSLQLTPVLDGDWDLRGHLDPETGTLLARELERREQLAADQAAAAEAAQAAAAQAEAASPVVDLDAAESDPCVDDGAGTLVDAETGAGGDDGWAAYEAVLTAEPDPHATVPRVSLAGRRRHDALTLRLRDLADTEPGTGRPAPTAVTVIAALDALEGRLGALPGTLEVRGARPVSLRPETLRRMGCYSELTVVLVDALGQPVGVSDTHRSATREQRAALRALWGPWCAIAGCTSTATIPHHVHPWWLSRQTVLRDLIPICEHDHRASSTRTTAPCASRTAASSTNSAGSPPRPADLAAPAWR